MACRRLLLRPWSPWSKRTRRRILELAIAANVKAGVAKAKEIEPAFHHLIHKGILDLSWTRSLPEMDNQQHNANSNQNLSSQQQPGMTSALSGQHKKQAGDCRPAANRCQGVSHRFIIARDISG